MRLRSLRSWRSSRRRHWRSEAISGHFRSTWTLIIWGACVGAGVGAGMGNHVSQPWGFVIRIACLLAIGICAGIACTMPTHLRRGYAAGWYEGRQAMVTSMAEAINRGLSVQEWFEAEMERDMLNFMGDPPTGRS